MATDSLTFDKVAGAETFRRFCRLLCKTTGLKLVFVAPDASQREWLAASRHQEPLCEFMRAKPLFAAACQHCDARHLEQVTKGGNGRSYRCHAGLVDLIVPVVIGGVHVGSFLGGQLLPQAPDEAGFRRFENRVARFAFEPALLQRHYFASPWMHEARIRSIIELITLFAAHFGELGSRILGTVQPVDAPVARACAYIRTHYKEHLTLVSVSRAAGLAPTYLSARFRQEQGETYAAYLRRLRVEHAARLIGQTQGRDLAWIADESGFGSMRSFNRAFRAVLRKTPSSCRAAPRLSRLHG